MPSTIWKGHLSFGLVSIPVKLYRAARAEKVGFRQVRARRESPGAASEPEPPAPPPRRRGNIIELPETPAYRAAQPQPAPAAPEPEPAPAPPPPQVERVRQAMVSESGERVGRQELLKGYEYAKDQYVLIDEAELKQIVPKTSPAMQIVECVRLAEIDPVFFESSYYVVPEKNGGRAYAILYEALRRTGYVALAQFAMHRREHIVIVRPARTGMVAHTMFYEDEIHPEDEYRTDTGLASLKELELAVMFVESLAAPFEPGKYRDSYREKLEAMIAGKLEGRQVAEAPPPQTGPEISDIMEALKNSLAAMKKPAAKEQAPPSTRAARKEKKK